jgi:hypothetical protein
MSRIFLLFLSLEYLDLSGHAEVCNVHCNTDEKHEEEEEGKLKRQVK